MARNSWKYMPFGYKLMLSYCVFILFPILLTGYVANYIFVDSIKEQTRTNIQGTLEQMEDNIAYKLDNIVRISDLLYDGNGLNARLRNYPGDWNNYETTTKFLLPRLQSTIGAANLEMWLSIYYHSRSIPEIYNNYGNDPIKVESQIFDLYHMERILGKPWYRQYPKEEYGSTMQWKQIEEDERFERISLLRRIVDTSDPLSVEEIGFIRISVHLSDLLESIDYRKIGNGATILILDEHGKIVTSSEMADLKGKLWDTDTSDDHMVIKEILPSLRWSLVALIPTDIIERDTSKVRLLTILIGLICFVVFFFVGIFVSRYFSKRVTKIVSVLDSFQGGDFHRRVRFKGKDEFTQIADALNEMGRTTDTLIREVYLTNIQKKEAEMESLQAQINPHFLYNTLSSISRLAKFGKNEKLHRMVMDLSKFYRLTLNEGRTVIPITNEMDQVRAYLDIQKTKYEERMNVHYDIEPEVLRYQTIKLIIQPFVENALEHAWCGDQIHIRITADLKDTNIVFKIIDDGIGMDPKLICQILDPMEGQNIGYGIRNVNQRIKLHYGEEYGVVIFSRPGIGTTVQITVPTSLLVESSA